MSASRPAAPRQSGGAHGALLPAASAPPDLALAEAMFAQLRRDSVDGAGVTRDAYGPGEQRAHALIAGVARDLGCEVTRDAASNLYVTMPGRDRAAPCAMTGSHLDSVPVGGNFDGAAGVVAGMAVLAGWRQAGFVPPTDVVVMGVRAEESTWFPYSYLGSKAAFGLAERSALDLVRRDTGRTLAEHLRACGGDPAAFGQPGLRAERIRRFVELHIEQGPVLVEDDLPVGIVTGIRGSLRYREARVLGEYAHSGAVPRRSRRDAMRAAALWIAALDDDWERLEQAGRDLVLTFGQVGTNPAVHAFSKVAGEVDVCVDVRSQDPRMLAEMDQLLQQRADEVAARCGTRFVLGPRTGSEPAAMDPALCAELEAAAAARDIACRRMASGAGHDAAVFAQQGVPTAMIFVRNTFGSHNPDEHMDLADFAPAVQLLADALGAPPASPPPSPQGRPCLSA